MQKSKYVFKSWWVNSAHQHIILASSCYLVPTRRSQDVNFNRSILSNFVQQWLTWIVSLASPTSRKLYNYNYAYSYKLSWGCGTCIYMYVGWLVHIHRINYTFGVVLNEWVLYLLHNNIQDDLFWYFTIFHSVFRR